MPIRFDQGVDESNDPTDLGPGFLQTATGVEYRVGSNGIWFASQFILIDNIVSMAKTGSWGLIVGTGVFYTTFTIIGSVGMHYISQHHIERKLKVNDHK